MNNQTPTAQSGPSDLDRLIRVGDLPAPITNPEAWPTGYADGFNDYARMVVQTAPTQSTPAGARDTVADEVAEIIRVLRESLWVVCTSGQWELVKEKLDRLAALTGKADGGDATGVLVCAEHGIRYRQGCIHCENDLADLEATQPAATGVGEDRVSLTHDELQAIKDAAYRDGYERRHLEVLGALA